MINFEKEFQAFVQVWIKREGLTQTDYDKLDDRLAEVYEEWLRTPQEAFGSKTPETFFDEVDNPFTLMRMLKNYIDEGITVPGPLLNRMVEQAEGVYPLIIDELEDIAGRSGKVDTLNGLYIALISEMKKAHPMEAYIQSIEQAENRLKSLEAMIDVLKNNVLHVKDKIKKAYLSTSYEYAKDSFLDILSEIPGDTDAYRFTLECFNYEISKCGMYAHMLSKIGNPECLPFLQERLNDPSLNYFNFCRVKEALEELGGESSVEREFSGDADYEYIADLNDGKDGQQEDEGDEFE